MKKVLLILCLFLILPAYSTTWVQIQDKNYFDKDSLDYYITDGNYIQYNQKTFWVKYLNDNSQMFKKFEKLHKTKIWYSLDKYIINFSNKTLAIKSYALYDLKGEVISSYTLPDYSLEWNSIVPNSYGEMLYELAKHPRYLRKMYKWQQQLNKQADVQ